MRDCVFLFADAEIQAAFQGFFSRQSFELTLETGPFSVDPTQDFLRDAAGKDSGVYLRAHEFLRPYQTSHRHAVVVLDEKWEGSPGAGKIREDIRQRLRSSGWVDERFAVIVIEPELENWIWQDNPHVERAFGFDSRKYGPLRQWLASSGLWPPRHSKPPDPKAAVLKVQRVSPSSSRSAVYRKICHQVSIHACKDSSFQQLVTLLREWFPREDDARLVDAEGRNRSPAHG